MHDNSVTLRPVHPNAGIEAEYRKKLKRLIADMHASIVYWISARYKATGLAQDGAKTPANELQDAWPVIVFIRRCSGTRLHKIAAPSLSGVKLLLPTK